MSQDRTVTFSIDMKTKVVQHVPRINISILYFPGSQLLSDVQTFLVPCSRGLSISVWIPSPPLAAAPAAAAASKLPASLTEQDQSCSRQVGRLAVHRAGSQLKNFTDIINDEDEELAKENLLGQVTGSPS